MALDFDLPQPVPLEPGRLRSAEQIARDSPHFEFLFQYMESEYSARISEVRGKDVVVPEDGRWATVVVFLLSVPDASYSDLSFVLDEDDYVEAAGGWIEYVGEDTRETVVVDITEDMDVVESSRTYSVPDPEEWGPPSEVYGLTKRHL